MRQPLLQYRTNDNLKTISRRFLAKADTDSTFRGLSDRAEGKNGVIRQSDFRF